MKHVLIALAAVALLALAACGDDDDSGPDISDVCPENPSPARESTVVLESPDQGAEVTNPIQLSGMIKAFNSRFYVAIIAADGTHLLDDYPGMVSEPDVLVPFQLSVPFFVQEPTEACVLIGRQAFADESRDVETLQLAVTLLPAETPAVSP